MKVLNALIFSSVLTLATASFAKDISSVADLEARINNLENKIQSMQVPMRHRSPLFDNDFMGWGDFDRIMKRHNMMMQNMMNDMATSSFSIDRNKDKIVVKAKLDSVSKDEIDISVENYVMTIKSNKETSKKIEKDESKAEIATSQSFMQQISLPKNANIDKIDTDFEDGELTITIPLEKNVKKQIKID